MGAKKNNEISRKDIEKTLHAGLEFAAIEQYKMLRANLKFTLPSDVKCPIVGVTSSMRGEGKSTTSINLSYVLSESGKKVLLIDGDLRMPSVASKMDIDNSKGLTDFLLGEELDIEEFKREESDNWYVLPSGNLPPNPSELLGSEKMKAVLSKFCETFDIIILDLPPVNIVSDALAVSDMVTGMLVVVRQEYTAKKELNYCMRQLELSGINILGCVLTMAKPEKLYGKYGKNYKYYKYYG